MLSGQNGILSRAGEASTKSKEAKIEEQINIAVLTARTLGLGEISLGDLRSELDKLFGANGYTITADGISGWKVTVEGKEYIVERSSIKIPSIAGYQGTDAINVANYGKTAVGYVADGDPHRRNNSNIELEVILSNSRLDVFNIRWKYRWI